MHTLQNIEYRCFDFWTEKIENKTYKTISKFIYLDIQYKRPLYKLEHQKYLNGNGNYFTNFFEYEASSFSYMEYIEL